MKRMRFFRVAKKQDGFTFVELMVVIAILGILATIAVPKFGDSAAVANGAKIQADLQAIETGLAIYQAQGKTISAGTTMDALVAAGCLADKPSVPSGKYKIGDKAAVAVPEGAVYAVNGDGRATFGGKTLAELSEGK